MIVIEGAHVFDPIRDLEEVYRDWPETEDDGYDVKTVLLRCGYAWPQGALERVLQLLTPEERERLRRLGRQMRYARRACSGTHLCPRCGAVLPYERKSISDPLVGHLDNEEWVTCPQCGTSYPRKTGRRER